FFRERLQFYLRENLGLAYDVVNAVLSGRAGYDDVVDAVARARDVTAVRPSADLQAIAAAFKRTKNILKQAEVVGQAIPSGLIEMPNDAEDAERNLTSIVQQIRPHFNELVLKREYDQALREVAKLRTPLDTFFDRVMVMSGDERQDRRLALLNTILYQFSTIADFSEIVTEGKA